MKTSGSIGEIVPALLNAQKKIKAAAKTAKNLFFKSNYADLASVIDSCKEQLNDEGILVLQPIRGNYVETILVHTSGEWITSKIRIVCAKENDPQAYGSAITYARRYALQSLILLPATDDDGNEAVKPLPKGNPDVDWTIAEEWFETTKEKLEDEDRVKIRRVIDKKEKESYFKLLKYLQSL